jgi:hypothetical protein
MSLQSKHFEYRLTGDSYQLYRGEEPFGPAIDEVAIALDRSAGTLMKHGDPEQVRAWYSRAQASFREAGFAENADDLVVISARFEVEDLNRCLTITGYAGKLLTRLTENTGEPSRDGTRAVRKPVETVETLETLGREVHSKPAPRSMKP